MTLGEQMLEEAARDYMRGVWLKRLGIVALLLLIVFLLKGIFT